MPFNNHERQRKDSKRSCFMCTQSPENILMLACDDSICLQCAYAGLKESSLQLRQTFGEQIEFRCKRCHEVTYFDRDLIKQIETSIRSYSQKVARKKDDSFIEKMKRQYLGGQSNSKPSSKVESSFQNKKDPTIINSQLNSSTMTSKQNDNHNKYFHDNLNNYQTKQRLFKLEEQQRFVINKQQKAGESSKLSQLVQGNSNTKCRSHSYYELLYYCVECQEIVCSQCLLRGIHKTHKNSSITDILSHQLPQFINHTSQKLLHQITHIQTAKDTKHSQLNKRLAQIKSIRQNAVNYFTQVKKNINKQQGEVLQRCDLLLNSLLQEERQVQRQQKEVEAQLACHIREIKSLKSSYKQFLEQQQQLLTRQRHHISPATKTKQLQRLLIEKFFQCSHSINDTFMKKTKMNSQQTKNSHSPLMIRKQQQSSKWANNSKQLENESVMLNRHIEQSIKSIRQSLVLPNLCTKQFINLANQQSKQKELHHHGQQGRPQYAQPQQSIIATRPSSLYKQQCSKPPKSPYISYLSTDNNSLNQTMNIISNSNFIKKQQRSLSISPYKAVEEQLFCSNTNNNNEPKTNVPKRHLSIKQANHDIEKQNISSQTHITNHQQQQQQKQTKPSSTKLSSQASSQNVSSKKKQSKTNFILSKSKNSSNKQSKITANKVIGKFQL